ncbi:hypothetical protein B0I35DRAFT_169032 [Stachybotrys elegans]|uniref:Uncharacterized protein n=1 Tax=Stachybotrys elegans TaxID=80388 RepID=A0A8K0WV64_9HYPO|nr:hypothetical protein B0I35DRAFT_169032 [Stachybotrys elegans]
MQMPAREKWDSSAFASYAWAADEAEFAAVATKATYAQRTMRLVGTSPSPLEPENLTKLRTYCESFEGIEGGSMSAPLPVAIKALVAGCADVALYAEEADEAQYAVEVIGEQ